MTDLARTRLEHAAALYALGKLRIVSRAQLVRSVLANPQVEWRGVETGLAALLNRFSETAAPLHLPHSPESSLRRLAEEFVQAHINTDVTPLPITDPEYPATLRATNDPPVILYVRGSISVLTHAWFVAVVGTRTPTRTGLSTASRIAARFAKAGFAVVSGLAKGIDTAAHQGTLEAGGKTAAILGTPLHNVYPSENRPLADRIIDEGGVLVSELSLRDSSSRAAFVSRDRIQSGLSLAVVPIQTDVKGGTMHTVQFAEQQRRLLFCPEPPRRELAASQYRGILLLIETGKAKAFNAKGFEEVLDAIRQHKEKLSAEWQAEHSPTSEHRAQLDLFDVAKPD